MTPKGFEAYDKIKNVPWFQTEAYVQSFMTPLAWHNIIVPLEGPIDLMINLVRLRITMVLD